MKVKKLVSGQTGPVALPVTAILPVLVGMMCGTGEGNGSGFAGGLLGTVIGIGGAWLVFRSDRPGESVQHRKVTRRLVGIVCFTRPFWLPLLVGVALVLSSEGLVRLIFASLPPG